ncbi:hypothetical protein A5876_000181 [Enterococcus sp. 3C8_DIV0646]|nr:hypothetical protein A5876_000181 [Enterococcus sp. 3C8_DIV0646]
MEADSVFSYLLFSKFVTFKGKRKDVNGYIQYIAVSYTHLDVYKRQL